MSKRLLTALAVLAVAGVAAASAITVTQRTDIVNVFAERFTLRDQFVVSDSTILPAAAAATALGTQGSPVEITGTLAAARTALARDHWVYAVTVEENAVASVTAGTYQVRLLLDGAPVGTVFLSQASGEDAAVEGARVAFDVGSALSTDALYHVEVKPFIPAGPTVSVTVTSNPNGNLTWLGSGDVVNPGVALTVGSTLQLTASNGDGGTHDIGIKTSGGALVDPPGWSPDIGAIGEHQTIAWTPGAAGTWTYVCKYHATMQGTIVVSA
jgi:hypothetical protein